jgi:hypothetical protein
MIHARIRIYKTLGQWKVYELGVSDGLGMSQHVLRAYGIYDSEQEAITIAKYEALLRIAEMWNSIPENEIIWDIRTISNAPDRKRAGRRNRRPEGYCPF